MSHLEHKRQAPASVACFVLTVSDTRTEATDTGGQAVVDLLAAAGHTVRGRAIVKDDPVEIRRVVQTQLGRDDVQAVITTGGTGISGRDGTVETIDGLLEKKLDGFGELFRMLSYQEIGAAAMLSRATGGASCGKIVLALPGAEAAVTLAMTRLVLPELGHLVREASR